ncbi:peptidase U32 family protein [Paenibacillus sp. KN14-4R]|uniref:peptidase U32 family protein n=1 Tax=Paenibacillus sp. KN14-4R TaxID=3445773 RepID=UPI003FA091A4
MKKPELLVSAGSLEEMRQLIEAGADAVTMGEHTFGLRLAGDVSVAELKEAAEWAHARGAKVYVSVNQIMTNEQVAILPDYLRGLDNAGVDGILFGDPAVLMAVKETGVKLKLHWNAEMTSTNYITANYWGTKGASRVFLARELNLEEVIDFKQHCDLAVQVQVHGITNIYHSRRELVRSYLEHQEKGDAGSQDRSIKRGLYLIEQERQDERYPIFEDTTGTHIMSSDDICMLESLDEVMAGNIDVLYIEGLMKSLAYNVATVKSYRAAIEAYTADPENYTFKEEWLDSIRELQDPDRELSFGFFFKEQVY